jgi:HK97 family phage major capsid protein
MSLTDRIKTAEAELNQAKDELVETTDKLEENPEDEALVAQVEEQSDEVEKKTASLAALKKAEAALASRSVPVTGAPSIILSRSNKTTPFDLVVRAALVAFEAGVRKVSPQQVVAERYGDDDQTKAVTGIITKATQNPAMTTVDGWAAQLVREGWLQFMDILKPASIIPRLGLRSYSFDGYGSLTIPMRNRGTGINNDRSLASSWRKEGDPIRVGSTQLGSQKLSPKSMGVIGTFTKELLKRSTPNIEQMIREWIISDTAEMLDGYFVSDLAAVADLRPGGIRAGVVAVPSGGGSAADINADLFKAFSALASSNLGSRPVVLLHPNNGFALGMSLTATGVPAFPSAASGSIYGAQILTSTTIPTDIVIVMDAAEIAFAGGLDTMEYSDVATLHEEYLPMHDRQTGAVDPAGVLPLVDEAGAAASPVRSLFQTHSAGIKAVYELDWSLTRPGAVYVISDVAWGQAPVVP